MFFRRSWTKTFEPEDLWDKLFGRVRCGDLLLCRSSLVHITGVESYTYQITVSKDHGDYECHLSPNDFINVEGESFQLCSFVYKFLYKRFKDQHFYVSIK